MTESHAGEVAARQESEPSHQPPSSEAIATLRRKLTENIDGFCLSAAKNKRRALIIKMTAASLGAATTLLLGLKSIPIFRDYENEFSALALVFSAVVPVFVAWDTFFDHRWLWVRFTAAHNLLFKTRDDLDYAEANKGLTHEVLDGLYKQFRYAVDQTSDSWIEKKESPTAGEQPTR